MQQERKSAGLPTRQEEQENEKKKWKQAYDAIYAEDELKEKTRAYLARKVYRKETRYRGARRWLPAAAAVCLFLCVGTFLRFFLQPTAYITIDVNPSVELGVNCFDRIVAARAYNKDGEAVLEGLSLRFLNYEDALEKLWEKEAARGYLTQDAVMSVAVSGGNTEQREEILARVSDCASHHEQVRCQVSCHGVSEETHHAAQTQGVSMGKYQAYLELRALDPTVTLEELRQMTMYEIYERLRVLQEQQPEQEGQTDAAQQSAEPSPTGGGHHGSHHAGEH